MSQQTLFNFIETGSEVYLSKKDLYVWITRAAFDYRTKGGEKGKEVADVLSRISEQIMSIGCH